MKSSKRIFKAGVPQHVYQRTYNRGLIFYTLEDYIFFYTTFCAVAKRMNLRFLSLCLMINHIHFLLRCDSRKILSKFVSTYSIIFVRGYNSHKGRTGPLFVKSFGSAPKTGRKSIMTAISYIGNNPIHKRLCTRAEDYRWGFLPYAASKNPFSKPIVLRKSSSHLRKSIALVKSALKRNIPLNYQLQSILYKRLNPEEKMQLIDFIISSYNVIDYQETLSYYGNYPTMMTAINSNSGSEYDIKEDWDQYSDKIFEQMISVADEQGFGGEKGYNFQSLKTFQLRNLAMAIFRRTRADPYLIGKFLHLKKELVVTLLTRGRGFT